MYLPSSIKILSSSFDIEFLSNDEMSQHGEGVIIDHFDILQQRIYINQDVQPEIQRYALFHAIWEILLVLMGQYYNHSGFQGFSFTFYSVLCENKLSSLLEGTMDG